MAFGLLLQSEAIVGREGSRVSELSRRTPKRATTPLINSGRRTVRRICLIALGYLVSASALQAQNWIPLDGPFYVPLSVTNRPVAGSNGALVDQVDVYVEDTSFPGQGPILVRSQFYSCRNRSGHPICASFFGGWINLGSVNNNISPPYGRPTAVGWGNHREVFELGSDGRLWHNSSDGPNAPWSGWSSLGGPTAGFCSQPLAISSSPNTFNIFGEANTIDLFGLGCDRQVWHRWLRPSLGWSQWQSIASNVDILDSVASASQGSFLLGMHTGTLGQGGHSMTLTCNDGVCAGNSTWVIHDLGPQGCNANSYNDGTYVSALKPAIVPAYAVIVGQSCSSLSAWTTFEGGTVFNFSTTPFSAPFNAFIPVGNGFSQVFYVDPPLSDTVFSSDLTYQRIAGNGWSTAFGAPKVSSSTVGLPLRAVAGVTPGSAYIFARQSDFASAPVVYTYVVN
jgi:hypothetical protein